jgi:hypothetical protein
MYGGITPGLEVIEYAIATGAPPQTSIKLAAKTIPKDGDCQVARRVNMDRNRRFIQLPRLDIPNVTLDDKVLLSEEQGLLEVDQGLFVPEPFIVGVHSHGIVLPCKFSGVTCRPQDSLEVPEDCRSLTGRQA